MSRQALNIQVDQDTIDQQDYTLIMDCLADMKQISLQVLQDVVDEITCELENRVEPVEVEAEEWTREESLDEVARRENAILDRQR